jgi:hypothetical protein
MGNTNRLSLFVFFLFITLTISPICMAAYENDAPDKPSTLIGESTAYTGHIYHYSTVARDPEGDDVFYQFCSEVGSSGWYGPFSSSQTVTIPVVFEYSGERNLVVRAKDEYGHVSPYSDPKFVNVLRSSERKDPVVHISITPDEIYNGDSATLTWSSAYTDSVEISGVDTGGGLTGSIVVRPTQSTLYTITGISADSEIIAVDDCYIDVIERAPRINFRADPICITKGNFSRLEWSVTDATEVSIDPSIVDVGSYQGSTMVNPRETTTYTLIAIGPGGTSTASCTVEVEGTNSGFFSGFADGSLAVPIEFIFFGILVVFGVANVIYYKKKGSLPPYKLYLRQIGAWIKNEKIPKGKKEEKREDDEKNFYDYVINYSRSGHIAKTNNKKKGR